MTKSELRIHHQAIRSGMTREKVMEKSKTIAANIMALPEMEGADRVFLYNAFGKEVILDHVLLHCPKVALPQVIGMGDMVFREIVPHTAYKRSAHGVQEPVDGEIVTPTDRSVILIPGSVFDRHGHRIGYGAGYYDRFLTEHPQGLKVGICYENQLVDAFAADDHDVAMDMVVTEARLVDCQAKG